VRAIIAIGLQAAPGTSTTGISLAEKLQIFKKCFDSCRREGFEIVLIGTGTSAGVEKIRKVAPGIPLWGVWGDLDRQRGECGIGLKMLEHAEQVRADWIIKVAGDTFHPTPGWAEALVCSGERAGAELVSCAHSRPDWVSTQVFAVKTAFMRKTWPPMNADYQRIGIEAQWGERVTAECILQNAEVRTKWVQPPAKLLHVDGCDNWVPTDPAITYLHAHCLASTAAWLPVDLSVKPDLKAKVSIVVPCRNEVQTNPHRGGVPLLSDTFASIQETSPADNLPECILVDDGSDKPLPSCPYKGSFRTIRLPSPGGVDPARNIGIAACGTAAHGCDVIGVLDGHMRVMTQTGEPCVNGIQKLAAVALERKALVVARCGHLEMPQHADPGNLCGAVFMPLTDPKSQLAISWRSQYPPDGVRCVNAVLGASYFAPREIWRKLQGFVNSCQVWGFSEEGLSLKAAFMDVPIYYCGDVTMLHWFRMTGPHPWPVDDFWRWINRARVLRVTFEEETFRNFWLPRCKGNSSWNPRYDAMIEDPSLAAEAAKFRAVKVRKDANILREIFKVNA